MRITLRQMQIFTAVADTGSTTAAGLQLALSQSATSGALNELEGLLGARLFDRVSQRLVLNDTGRTLLPQARALLAGAQAIEAQFGLGRPAGAAVAVTRLRIGASTTIGNYLLPALLAGFRASLPGPAQESWQVQVAIANTAAIAASVAAFELDLGLIEGPCHEPALTVQPWREDELVIVTAANDPILPKGRKSPCWRNGRPPRSSPRKRHWSVSLSAAIRWSPMKNCWSAMRCIPWSSSPGCKTAA